MKKELVNLSKIISYALRHKPDKYNLILDGEGWVLTSELLTSIKTKHPNLVWATSESIADIIDLSDKSRFELSEYSIRALYGHSIPEKIIKTPETPPYYLYHGTTENVIDIIMKNGLQPMRRQYVHLSVDIDTAVIVGKRRTRKPIILKINTKEANRSNIKFYKGNDSIWLSEAIPSEFITLEEDKI